MTTEKIAGFKNTEALGGFHKHNLCLAKGLTEKFMYSEFDNKLNSEKKTEESTAPWRISSDTFEKIRFYIPSHSTQLLLIK